MAPFQGQGQGHIMVKVGCQPLFFEYLLSDQLQTWCESSI
jgi:hypothetical protein